MLDISLHLRSYRIFENTGLAAEVWKQNTIELIYGSVLCFLVFAVVSPHRIKRSDIKQKSIIKPFFFSLIDFSTFK